MIVSRRRPRAATSSRPAAALLFVAGMLASLAALLVSMIVVATGAGAATPAGEAPLRPPASSGAYFGPILDWTADTAHDYASRLGDTPALYGQSVHYPLTRADDTYLDEFAQQAAGEGSFASLQLEPSKPLAQLTVADARHLASMLKTLHRDDDTRFYVRFAPEMNGSWKSYGQQPDAYVAAFRRVATAVHDTLPRSQAVMVWAPAYGAGYPFANASGKVNLSGPRVLAQLDTNHDGKVTDADDPYAPYYPGDSYVDWVGLSLYDYGVSQPYGQNQLPAAGRFAAELAGTFGYGSRTGQGRDFLGTYAVAKHKPMFVETGALYDPSVPSGPGELAIKRDWWRQVFTAARQHPQIRLVTWLEQQRVEPEVGSRRIDWRATHTPALAAALRSDLRTYGLSLGPVLPIHDLAEGNKATAQAAGSSQGNDDFRWIVLCAAILLVLYLASGLAVRFVPSWRYPDEDKPRDRRLDVFRGWIIVAVVVTHIEVAGPYEYVTLNMIGAITGAEMFVLLSGVVLGMVFPLAIARAGQWPATKAMLRRAGKLYLAALGVILVIFGLSYVPGVNTDVITTFTDRGTGAGGAGADGRVYDLYPNAAHLLDYPPPGYVVRDLLLLRIGPWPINILGLFVVLTALVPALVWLLRKRLWWLVLIASWTLYVLDRNRDVLIFHAQFEDAFPLLTWQVAFLNGLVIGYYRRRIVAFLRQGLGKILISLFVIVYCGGLIVLYAVHRGWLSVPGLSDHLYQQIAVNGYVRIFLQPGRLLDLALMLTVAYAFLTAFWKPVSKAFAWFYEPLGQNSLYVFIVHVFFVLAVGNIRPLDRHSAWQGFVVHTAVLAIIWLMVRYKVLFKVIPS